MSRGVKPGVKAEALHARALGHQWERGTLPLIRVLEDEACDGGTALLIYWRAAPQRFLPCRSLAEVPEATRDLAALVWLLEPRLLAQDFATNAIRYDPTDDEGVDRTVISPAQQANAVRTLPLELQRTNVESPVQRARAKQKVRPPDTLTVLVQRNDVPAVRAQLDGGGITVPASLLEEVMSVDMARVLLEHGARAEAITLHRAVFLGPALVRFLAAAGAPLDAVDSFGETAAFRAATRSLADSLRALKGLGAVMDCPRADGKTAWAVVSAALNTVQAKLRRRPHDAELRAEAQRCEAVLTLLGRPTP